jgi:hypothetical protein
MSIKSKALVQGDSGNQGGNVRHGDDDRVSLTGNYSFGSDGDHIYMVALSASIVFTKKGTINLVGRVRR